MAKLKEICFGSNNTLREFQLVAKDNEEKVLAEAEIWPFEEGVALLWWQSFGHGAGVRLFDELLRQHGVVYSGRCEEDKVSADALLVFEGMGRSRRYQVEATGIPTEINEYGNASKSEFHGRPEHVKIRFAEPGEPREDFYFQPMRVQDTVFAQMA